MSLDHGPDEPDELSRGGRRSLLLILPAALFGCLAVLFAVMLYSGRDASVLPSALVGQPAPQTALEPLFSEPGSGSIGAFDTAAFEGRPTLVNVFASWCVPCRDEHPILMDLSRTDGLVLAGLNYKDDPEDARAFLDELGNPYDLAGSDRRGRAGIDWGVYGVPETFLVDPDGTIVWKHVGPLTSEVVERDLRPLLADLSD